jgi:MtN3 and saliva related transmembrane protein
MDATECIGLAAGVLTLAAHVPQICKTWRSKKAVDISPGMYLAMVLGTVLWLVYGICRGAAAIIVANAVGLALTGLMLGLTLSYGRRNAKRSSGPHGEPGSGET